ncbi:DUF317 domain-containing protein [Streptomyces lydicus]
MAGDGSSVEEAFAPLTYHYWHDMGDELGNHYTTTCDSQLRVAFVPEESEILPDGSALWQVHARTGMFQAPLWTAAFTDETPPEIIAGLTAALDADVSDGSWGRHPYLTRNDHPDVVWDVMRTADWQVTVDGLRVKATSPDGLASFAYRPSSLYGPRPVPRGEAWRATVYTSPDARRPLWEADFHSATPAHLVASFATALTNPAPLTRESVMLPEECRAHARPLHEPITERASVAPTPLDIRRVQAARTRSIRTSDSTLRWSTTSQNPAAAAGRRTAAGRRR